MDESSSDEEVDSVVSLTPPEPPYSVAASMTPVKSATPVDNDHTSNKYPHLSRALGDEDGYFDPADPSVIKSMQGLLQEINNLLSLKYDFNLRAITFKRPISYVRVPRTKSDNAFTNSKEWLDTAITVSESQHGGTFESVNFTYPNDWVSRHRTTT